MMFKTVLIAALETMTWLLLYLSLISTEVLSGPVAPTYNDRAVCTTPKEKYFPGIKLSSLLMGSQMMPMMKRLISSGIISRLTRARKNVPK